MRVIAIANQKGGCGKTTTAINLSASLAFLRKNVLLIDLDPQGHSTCGLGIKAEFLEHTAYDLFQENGPSTSDLIVSVNDYLSLIPSHVILSRAEQEWSGQTDAYNSLTKRLQQVNDSYDYAIIDSPPNLGLLTFNALCTAEEVIIPIEPSFFALHGLAKIFETIDSLSKLQSKRFRLHALLTRYEKRTKLAQEIKEEVRKHFKEQMFVNVINENIRLREAAASGKSIVDFDRDSNGFRNYMGLAIEVIERGLIWHATVPIASAEDQQTISSQTTAPLLIERSGSQAGDKSPSAVNSHFTPSVTLGIEENLTSSNTQEKNGLRPRQVFGGILFSYSAPKAASVLIAGDFNRWVTEPLILVDKKSGCWQKLIPLEAGIHHYKFLVDDEWRTDPLNPAIESNPYGVFDSVIVVERVPAATKIQDELANTGTS